MKMFNVGDKVKINSNSEMKNWDSFGEMKRLIGSFGKVKEVDKSDPTTPCIEVFCENSRRTWWFNEEDLEMVDNMQNLIDLIAKYPIGMKLRLSTQYSWQEDLEVCGHKEIDSNMIILFSNGTSVNADRIAALIVSDRTVND